MSGLLGLITWFWTSGCASSPPIRDYSQAPPPADSTMRPVEGRWIDLEEAVAAAASDAEMAVTTIDRWQTMVQFELVTVRDQPAKLVVMGDRTTGLAVAEIRVGRFRDVKKEAEFLEALDRRLREWGRRERAPESR